MVLQAAFFKLANVIPVEDAVEHMKAAVKKTYGLKGEKVVNMNIAAVDAGINALVQVQVKPEWKNLSGAAIQPPRADVPDVIKNILVPINAQKGDDLPVSAFRGMEDGTMPLGTSQYEKRGIATHLPVWDKSECIQCNRCSFVCPHAVIRPYLLNEDEVKNAPPVWSSPTPRVPNWPACGTPWACPPWTAPAAAAAWPPVPRAARFCAWSRPTRYP